MKTIFSLLAASLALSLPFAFPAQSSSEAATPSSTSSPQYVQTRLVPEYSTLKPGSTLTLAIVQDIAPGWHTYWKNPGDSGEALNVEWHMPPGFIPGDLQWTAPHRIPIGPLVNFGYDKQNVLLTDIVVPSDIAGPDITITADLEWLVCEEICVPESTTLSLKLPVADDATAVDPPLFASVRAALPRQVAWPGMVEEQDGVLLLTFTPENEGDTGLKAEAGEFAFFPEEWGLIQNASPQEAHWDGKELTLRLSRDTRALQEVGQIKGLISFHEDGKARAVNVQLPVPAMPAAIENIAAASLAAQTPPSSVSFWQAITLALLGGLILNLMPCVFPVLSMKALSLVKMSEREQSHAVMHGVMYTLGILVCFAGISALLIILQQTGSQIGWGFQLQNPVVVLLLAYLLFMLGLNLSGMYEIGGGRLGNLGAGLTKKQGYSGSFFTGMLATVVATPCTAPFMGAAIGYALTQSPVSAMAIFLALGLGLALPYLLLTLIPALRRALPRPGAWMETFRQFLAFPMYASTAWLIWVYAQQIDGAYGLLFAGMGLVFIAMGIWLWKKAPPSSLAAYAIKAFSLACFGLAILIAALSMSRTLQQDTTTNLSLPAEQHSGNWTPFTKDAFDRALSGNDPVFVNMTASWCITCKVNERVALAIQSTKDLFAQQKVLYLIGDWTNQNPEITTFLQAYGRNGVPLYVYFGSRDLTTGKRPDPVVLPQLLTPGLVEDIVTYN